MVKHFLSHAGEDRADALALATRLVEAGVDVWCDALPDAIPSGTAWVRALQDALEDAGGYLLLVGARGVDRWVRAELDYALNRNAVDPSFRVLPVLLPGAEPESLPPFVARFQALRLDDAPSRLSPEALAALVAALLGSAAPTGPGEAVCPFPGLEPFDEDLSRFFFGRREELWDAIGRIGQTPAGYRRWLQIEGSSGSGKSSFVRAGLVPAVRRGWVAGAPSRWVVATFRPGRDPVRNLAKALATAFSNAGRPLTLPEAGAALRSGAAGLIELVCDRTPRAEGFLLVMDQAEEAFTLAADDPAALPALDALLAAALEDRGGPFHLATTIRSDFLARLAEAPRLEALLNARAARFHLRAMTPEGLQEIVRGPARLAGLEWEAGLAERLYEDAAHERGALPLVGHVLRALWERRSGHVLTNRAYDALGGVAGALSRNADALVGGLAAPEQARARALLLGLVKIGRGAEDTARPLDRSEAVALAGGGREGETVLHRLSGGPVADPNAMDDAAAPPRLVVVEGEGADAGVQLAHDALLRHWSTLRGWVEAERQTLERRDDLESVAHAWEAAERDPGGLPQGGQLAWYEPGEAAAGPLAREFLSAARRAQRRRTRRRIALVAGAILFFAVAATVSLWQWTVAADQRDLAERRLRDAVEVAEQVVFDIDARLDGLGSAGAVRRDLLDKASGLLDRLREDAPEDDETLRLRAAAHVQRGDLATALRDFPRARDELEAALRLTSRRVRARPDDVDRLRELAKAHSRLADLATETGDDAAARRNWEGVERVARDLLAREPDVPRRSRDLAAAVASLAAQDAKEGVPGCRARFEDALALMERATEGDPERVSWQRDRAGTLVDSARCYAVTGDHTRARTVVEEGAAIIERLAAAHPDDANLMRDAAATWRVAGEAAWRAGDLSSATAQLETARGRYARLDLARRPGVQLEAAEVDSELGTLAVARGDLAKARRHFEDARAAFAGLVLASPGDRVASLRLVVALRELGEVASGQGDDAAARAAFDAAETTLRSIEPLSVRAEGGLFDAMELYDARAALEERSGDRAAARAAYEASAALARRASVAAPADEARKRDLARRQVGLGRLAAREGEHDAARAAYDAALEAWRELLAAAPDDAERKVDLALTYRLVGDLEWDRRNAERATAAYGAARDLVEPLASEPDASPASRQLLAACHDGLGQVRLAARDLAGARASFEAALAIVEELHRRQPDAPQWRRDLAVILTRLGGVLAESGDADGGRQALARAADLRASVVGRDATAGGNQPLESQLLLADSRRRAGDLAGALEALDEALPSVRELPISSPGAARAKEELARAYVEVCEAHGPTPATPGARAAAGAAATLARQLSSSRPDDQGYALLLGVALDRLGIACFLHGDAGCARAAYDDLGSLAARQLEAGAPGTEWERTLAYAREQRAALVSVPGGADAPVPAPPPAPAPDGEPAPTPESPDTRP